MKNTVISLNGAWQFKGYIGEDWLWRGAQKAQTRDTRGWHTGTVPGSVHDDLWKGGVIPDPYFEMNSLAVEWVPERTWLYKKSFQVPEELRGQRILLVCKGVDYSTRFYLNDQLVGENTGMFLPAVFEVDDRLNYGADNVLSIVIDPAPFEQPQIGYTSKVYTQKPRMNYWWDFCPRMVHIGIWEDVYLHATGPARIDDAHVQTQMEDDYQRAQVAVRVRLDQALSEPAVVEVSIVREGQDAYQEPVCLSLDPGQQDVTANITVETPALWWPNGAGEQPLYQATVRVLINGEISDETRTTFGIREVKFVPNEDAPAGALGYTLSVNGRKLYINGWNWVPIDVLYGVERPEKRERLLTLAKRANVNLLRVWGGGLYERAGFYDLCDRLGILVWQEFIQSSSGIDNFPSSDPAFIEFLVRNAGAAIRARRNHPSLAAWCGGNELHYAQDRLVDDSHPALAALKETVERLDPGRYWLPSSPSGGVFGFGIPASEEEGRKKHDVHGPWEYQGLRKQYDLYNRGTSLLHSEFGVEGITNMSALNATISPERQWPVSLNNPVWEHLGAWWVKEKVWAEAFGSFSDIAEAQRATQFLQADGLRYAVEADRRRQFHNSGTLPWQFNEPYPMAGCTSAVDYFANPKPVYYTVARAYRPLSVTARFDTIAWHGEEQVSAEVWVSNAGEKRPCNLSAQVQNLDGSVVHEEVFRVDCPANASKPAGKVIAELSRLTGEVFFLVLHLSDPAENKVLAENTYLFTTGETLAPLLHLPAAGVTFTVEKAGEIWRVSAENRSTTAAAWLWYEAQKPDLRASEYAYFSDNYFCLLPGEQREVQVEWTNVPDDRRKILAAGWNVPHVTLS